MSDVTITVDQGSDYLAYFTVKLDGATPSDLTGYTFKAQVRRDYDSESVAEFRFTLRNQTTSTGQVDLLLPSTAFSIPTLKKGTKFISDVVIIKPDGKKSVLFSMAIIVNRVTTL